MSLTPDVQPIGWLFTRGDTSVRMTVEHLPTHMSLIVRGPGTASEAYHFADPQALKMFVETQERQLQQEGFQLQAIAERRTRSDRQDSAPGTPDRRRR